MIRALLLACVMCLLWPQPVRAQAAVDPTPLAFESTTEEKRFRGLIHELRCVMCQNQSLADSNAQIAHDLRREVLSLMRRGHSDAEIRDHLVARYGEFVLYRPRVGPATWLLWFGPLLVLGAGVAVIWRVVASRRAGHLPPHDDSQEW